MRPTPAELACVRRYVELLRERLGDQLVEVRLFGSAARGDMWPATSPMHSDIDLLVLTRDAVPAERQDALIDETYPLFLECGRQISPAFLPLARWEGTAPRDRDLREHVERDGRPLWPDRLRRVS